MKTRKPPIVLGAYALAGLSLIWSGYAITDLMDSGPFGLSVAVAGDIGWITVMWAEHRRIGGRWATAAGWLIALGVGLLLVLHGVDEQSTSQAIAGPFVVLVGKAVGAFALLSLRDPAALLPEQEAEIHNVMRASEYEARLHAARRAQIDRAADAEIDRIRAEARTVLARDEADFEITLERLAKRAELARRAPLALPPAEQSSTFDTVAEQAITVVGEHDHPAASTASTIASTPNTVADQIANNATTSTNTDREQPSIADLVREQIAITPNNADAIRSVMVARPDANKASVAAAVRRERAKTRSENGYA